ncbi:hypothetical protein A4X13_0g9364, partial [Tilletia indica]
MAPQRRGSSSPASWQTGAIAHKIAFAPPVSVQTLDMTSALVPKLIQTTSSAFLRMAGGGRTKAHASAIDSILESNACLQPTNAHLGTIALAVGEMAAVQSRASRTAHDEALIAAFRHPACVPLRQGAFEQALLCLSPSHQIRLARIPENVISGFSMGPLSLPTTTIIAPNHFRPDQLTIIHNWKDDALKKGFAAGPFRVEAIERLEGPIVTIPLTVVHTPATSSKPAKDRVCFNATWDPNKHLPEGTLPSVVGSVNHELRDEDIECEWFLVNEVKV